MDDRTVEYLADVVGEDLVGKRMTDMFRKANKVFFLSCEACMISHVVVGGISWMYSRLCRRIQRARGYSYLELGR
jgi:hypothetical protein